MNLVLFGFEAFGQEPVNPSGAAVMALHGRALAGVQLHAVVLPVLYEAAFPTLLAHLRMLEPVAVMGVGQGRARFAVETVARNLAGARPDNGGVVQLGEIDPRGPATLRARWDAGALRRAIHAAEPALSCVISEDAGDYLCNHTLYRLLQWSEDRVPAGFLHVPTRSAAPQATVNRAVEAAVTTLVRSIAGRGCCCGEAEGSVLG